MGAVTYNDNIDAFQRKLYQVQKQINDSTDKKIVGHMNNLGQLKHMEIQLYQALTREIQQHH